MRNESLQPNSPTNALGTFTENLRSEPPSDDVKSSPLDLRPDSRTSQTSQTSQQTAYSSSNGSTYTVASGQSYLGHVGGKDQPPLHQQPAFHYTTSPNQNREMWS